MPVGTGRGLPSRWVASSATAFQLRHPEK